MHKNSQQLGKDKVPSGTDIFSRLAWAQKMFSFSDHCSWFHEIAELMNNIQYQSQILVSYYWLYDKKLNIFKFLVYSPASI